MFPCGSTPCVLSAITISHLKGNRESFGTPAASLWGRSHYISVLSNQTIVKLDKGTRVQIHQIEGHSWAKLSGH